MEAGGDSGGTPSSGPRVCLIVAVGKNRVIGRNNRLPWHLPDDLRRFKRLTMGKPVIMGRRTFESLGRPLKGRRNIVLSRKHDFRAPGCEVAHCIEEALDRASSAGEVFVIGGGAVFEAFLPFAEWLYLTVVDAEVPGDTFFPPYEHLGWEEVERIAHPADRDHCFSFAFVTLRRAEPAGRRE